MHGAVSYLIVFGITAAGLCGRASAVDPVAGFVIEQVSSKILDEVWDAATGRPNVYLLDKRLKEVEQDALLNEEMRREVSKLRARVNESVTRDEYSKMSNELQENIGAISKRLDGVESRVERLEVENQDIRAKSDNASSPSHFVIRARQFRQKNDFNRALANLTVALSLDPKCIDAFKLRCEMYAERKAWGVVAADASAALAVTEEQRPWFCRQRFLAISHQWKTSPVRFSELDIIRSLPVIPITVRQGLGGDLSEVLKDNRSDSDALCLFALTELRVAKSMASVTREKNEHTEVFLKRLIDSRTIDDLLPIQLFDRAIDADSNNATAYCGRGLAKDLAGKSGMDDYDQAIRLAPNMADAYLLRAMSKANTQSLADLNKANELEPSNPIILCHRAIRLIDVDNQKAVADLVELTRLMPNYLPTYEMLASVYFKLGDPVNALKYAGIGQEISRALEHQK